MPITSINPATDEVLKLFEPIPESEILKKVKLASELFRTSRKNTIAWRSEKMLKAAEILENEKDKFGRIMTLEMGKPLRAATEEALKCAWACRFYAENTQKLLADEVVKTGATLSYIHYQPLGPILAVMPWNFPFWQVFRFAAPALMAGNTAVLKHSSNVPQCALAIQEIFLKAGFPEGTFQTLLIGSDKVPLLLKNPAIMAATLTGSEPAGRHVASMAGKEIKKTVLELGGSDPFIVMPSADLEEAAKTAVRARTINNGQSCIAAKRFILAEKIADGFEKRFKEIMEGLVVGDPMEEKTDIGPLATADVLEGLDAQVKKSVEMGARILTGGFRLGRRGNYYAPTILTDIPVNSPVYSEEVFGPVALTFRVSDIEAAIRLANDTAFGLGSSAWTNTEAEKMQFIEEIEAGAVFINGMVVSDPRLPFGGIKSSGYGRELGAYGIREFVNIKTVWVK